jgi:hypothetical protein
MAEWFKAHAWKACVGNTTVGSNPTLSAIFVSAQEIKGNLAESGISSSGLMKSSKTFWKVLIGLAITVFVLGAISIIPLKQLNEFCYAENVKGCWASVQNFVNKNGRYPKDDAELGAFFHETPDQMRHERVEYIAPRDANADEVILWYKERTVFGVRVGITESGTIVKQ